MKCDKTGEVRVTLHRGAFVKRLLLWESSECSIFWVCLCSFGQQHAKHLRLSRSTTFFPTSSNKWHCFRWGVVTARELHYLTLFLAHTVYSCVPSLNKAAVIRLIIAVWIEAVLVLLCHEFKLASLLRFYRKWRLLKALPNKLCSSQFSVDISESPITCRSQIMAGKYPVQFYETKFRNFSQRNVTKLISK